MYINIYMYIKIIKEHRQFESKWNKSSWWESIGEGIEGRNVSKKMIQFNFNLKCIKNTIISWDWIL